LKENYPQICLLITFDLFLNKKWGNSIRGKIIDFYFKEEKEDGSLKTVGYYVKHNRGKLLNELVKNQVESIDEIKKIDLDGYQYNKEHSNENEFYFIKPFEK